MEKNRWWHVAVSATGVVLTIVLLLDDMPAWRMVGAEVTLWVFVVSWFLIGRLANNSIPATVVFLTVVILTAGVGTGFEPSMAIMQTIAYPLVWVFSRGLRTALVANVLLALSVGIGFLFSLGVSEPALVQTAATVTLSLGFSMAMGLGITHIWHLSDERRGLIDELRATHGQLEGLHRDAGATAERERLAREIHDTIAQSLTGLVAQGHSNPAIARRLFLSEATVKTHLLHVFEKLGVNDRTRAVTRAMELKLL